MEFFFRHILSESEERKPDIFTVMYSIAKLCLMGRETHEPNVVRKLAKQDVFILDEIML